MDPAAILGGMREGINKHSTHDQGGINPETGYQAYKAPSNELLKLRSFQTVKLNRDHLRIPPQLAASGLRHNVISDGANTNMQTTYERIQAYKPPPYVSPYGGGQSNSSTTNQVNLQSMREFKAPRLPLNGAPPPWLCCFAKREVPEWNRHKEIWNPGTQNTCTIRPCQHKKCADCLWESLEEVPGGAQGQVPPLSRHRRTEDEEQDAAGVNREPADREMDLAGNVRMMAPPSMPASRGINRDPKTGRPRLWTKD
ncbi:hypothetical protein IFR05_010686 [Cadophora sp. M221]|nr:hypothetical protein IFR05_010686 [Cadophora sp. M221]